MRVSFSSFVAVGAVALALAVAPNSALAQAKASVCKDGTTSAATGKGACSGHGGVDVAKTQAAAKAATAATSPAKQAAKPVPAATAAPMKAAPVAKKEMAAPPAAKKELSNAKAKNGDKDPAGATAQCKDGSYSYAASHRGACSKHGGVAKFLK